MGFSINDATCPLVMKVQSIIKRYAGKGYNIIIVGDEDHAEVKALLGFAEGKGIVVGSITEVERLPHMREVYIVAQTTMNRKRFIEIAERIKERYPDCKIVDTICDATDKRQKEVWSLAKEVDAMIIVGGRNSANTKRLAEISESTGTSTFLIETEEELDSDSLNGFNAIGITAGASTPNWMIRRVVEKVKSLKRKRRGRLIRYTINLGEFLIKSNIYVAIGAAFLTYASCTLQGIYPNPLLMLIATLYIFSMYILNSFTDQEAIRLNEPGKTEFLRKNKRVLIELAVVSAVISILFSVKIGLIPFLLLLLSSILGIFYSIKIIPLNLSRDHSFQRLKDIPASKDLFVALAWTMVTVLIPYFSTEEDIPPLSTFTTFLFVFLLVYIRSVLFDIRDIQGDRIIGRETIPILIGKENTKIFLVILAGLSATGLLISRNMGWTSNLTHFMLLSILYTCGYLYLYHKRVISHGLSCEAVVDGKFILVGCIAFIWAVMN
jgi:4-hydroxy-3-methylbut-2-enyl diphosphate reductase